MWVRGHRVSVGAARFTGSAWCWVRQVRKNLKGRLACHWFCLRSGWVISDELLGQVRPWAEVIVYADECGGIWKIPTEDVQRVGERILIAGVPHRCVAAQHWHYTAPACEQLHLGLSVTEARI